MEQKIIILDFGSQTTQLIGRRVRELDSFCKIVRRKGRLFVINKKNPKYKMRQG